MSLRCINYVSAVTNSYGNMAQLSFTGSWRYFISMHIHLINQLQSTGSFSSHLITRTIQFYQFVLHRFENQICDNLSGCCELDKLHFGETENLQLMKAIHVLHETNKNIVHDININKGNFVHFLKELK